jgi:hypothetical protein
MARPSSVRAAVMSVLAALVAAAPAAAQTVASPFAGSYSITNLGPVPGVPAPYGALTFQAGQPNTLLIGGNADQSTGAIFSVGVTRNAAGHVTGFSGPATQFASAPNIDGGLAYGPNNVLFYTALPDNTVGQIKPGSTAPDRVVPLPATTASVGSLAFVPNGYPGAGSFHLSSFLNSGYFSADLTPDGSGTFNITNVTLRASLSGGLEGLAHVPLNSPVFTGPSVLVAEYDASRVSAYRLDANGIPDPSTRQDFITGLTGPIGATIDLLTGDLLLSTLGDDSHVIRVSGFLPVPEPAWLLAAGLGALALAGYARRQVQVPRS